MERASAYNGVCTTLVTPTGAAAPRVRGTVRAGSPLRFPTQTIAITDLFPDFASYKGPTPDFGRMEPTAPEPPLARAGWIAARAPPTPSFLNASPAQRSALEICVPELAGSAGNAAGGLR